MEGGPRAVSRPNQEPQTRHQTPQADHGPDARKSAEAHRRPILPAENRARPYGYSPEMDQTASAGGAADPDRPGGICSSTATDGEPKKSRGSRRGRVIQRCLPLRHSSRHQPPPASHLPRLWPSAISKWVCAFKIRPVIFPSLYIVSSCAVRPASDQPHHPRHPRCH